MSDSLSNSKRKNPENAPPESEKRMKPESNSTRVLTECSTPATSEIPGPNNSSKNKSSNISSPMELSDKLDRLSSSNKCKNLAISQCEQIIITDDIPQEPTQITCSNHNVSIMKYQVDAQNVTGINPDNSTPQCENLHRLIKGASSYTLQIHEIQMRIKELSDTSKSYKQLALKLYLSFPKEYEILHTLLTAPPKSELKDVFSDSLISMEKGLLFTVYLTRKAQTMTVKQKQCFISVGESSIKPRFYYNIKRDILLGIHDHDDVLRPQPATTAIVMIVQGIFENWKQPIAISYLANDISFIRPWVARVTKNLAELGFDVRAIVSHKDFKYFSKDVFAAKKKKVYCLSDLSSLFISFFYNFTKCDYSFNDSVAKFQYIKDYVQVDSNRKIPITPKLTESVLTPASIEEVDIKSVMEVFSSTTAAAISLYVDLDLIDTSAKYTVELITKMNKLYNILSAGRWNDENVKGFAGEKSQKKFLEEMLQFFDHLEVVKSKRDSSFKIGALHKKGVASFRMQIKNVLSISEQLKSENYENIPVGRFTIDAIKLFFDQVQNHSKSITKPTAKEIDFMFRQTAMINLLKKPATGCKIVPMEYVLTEYNKIAKAFKCIQEHYRSVTDTDIISNRYKINTSEYATLDVGMGRKDGIILLAGFLLKKCADIHRSACKDFQLYIKNTAREVETLSMCESIMDEVRKKVCILPSVAFIEFVEALEIIFRAFMNRDILCATYKALLSSLLKSTETIDGSIPMPCVCFPIIYMKKLYMRFRIYHTLKYNNELQKTKLGNTIIVNKL